MYMFSWQLKIKKEQQSFIISLLFVWNNFDLIRVTKR